MCLENLTTYINPFTDYGFKKIFGEESSKPQLISFINAFLELENKDKIVDLEFRNLEKLGLHIADRKAIFDIYCTDQNGNHIIVELQKAKQNWFKDRMIYYSSFPIQEQGLKGHWLEYRNLGKNDEKAIKKYWDYKLKAVYCIGILDFEFTSPKSDKELETIKEDYLHLVKLKDQNNEVFYDKLTFAFVEMPKFTKKEDELETYLDKWFFFLNNLESLDKIPEIFKDDKVITDAFKKAEYVNLSKEEQQKYFNSLKVYRDLFSVVDTAKKDGYIEGLKKAQKEVKQAKKEKEKAQKEVKKVQKEKEKAQKEVKKVQKEKEKAQKQIINLVKLLLDTNTTIEKIAEITKLSIKEIKNIEKL